MSRARPLAQHRRREQFRVVPLPVTRAERDTCLALERCGIDRDMIARVVLPLTRPARTGPRR